MKEIVLTKGKTTLVDDEDFEYLSQYNWQATTAKRLWYVIRNHGTVLMHREIMKTPINMVVDHIDGNGLNNQKSNLRNCSQSANLRNSHNRYHDSYRGVSFHKTRNNYRARIHVGYDEIFLGSFKTEIEAAKAYNNAAIKYFGDDAKLNEV